MKANTVKFRKRSPEGEDTAETILVVDDCRDLGRVAALLLEGSGYHVLMADHAEQAKEISRRHVNIDLLLTDVEMPVMMGDELAEWFRATRPRMPVVFMSGDPGQHQRLGSCYFVEKPFRAPELLVEVVREALRHSDTSQEPAPPSPTTP
jgi:two-component system cell cycle sensor histidine kinase/response regulator CckA